MLPSEAARISDHMRSNIGFKIHFRLEASMQCVLGGAVGKKHLPKQEMQIPGLGRSPGGGNGSPTNILAWKIPWTEEPGGLQSM